MEIQVLYFAGCPSYGELMPRLRALVLASGLDPNSIQLQAVETVEDAERQRFLGSPSIRINGRDVDPTAAKRTDYGLKCRIYRWEGAARPTPPNEWIRRALQQASTDADTGAAPAGR